MPTGSTSPITSSVEPVGVDRDALDGAVGGAHAAADLGRLERRPGGRRRGEHAVDGPKRDLAVGADVDEQPQPPVARQPGGEHAGDDVAADVGAQRGEHERRAPAGARRRRSRWPVSGGNSCVGDHERRHRQRLGIDPERELHHRHVAAHGDLVDLARRHAGLGAGPRRSARPSSRGRGRAAPRGPDRPSSSPRSRVITSAPKGCWRLSIERTAAGWPLSRSSSVATTVVVPRSNAIAKRRAVVSPGSTSISSSSQTTAVTSKFARRSVPPSVAQRLDRRVAARGRRARRARAAGRSAGPPASARRAPGGASGPPGAGSRGARRRPAPPWAGSAAAAPRRPGRSRAPARHASRQPSRSSSVVNARGSTLADRARRRRRSAPCTSCRCRGRRRSSRWRSRSSWRRRRSACRSGTRTSAPSGRKRSRTRWRAVGLGDRRSSRSSGASLGASAALMRADAASCGRRPGGRGGRRSSCAPQASWPSSRSTARTDCTQTSAVDMIALVSPAAIAIGRKAGVEHVALGQPEGDVGGAQAHVDAELVADQADRRQRGRDRLGVGADGHRQRVDDHVLGGDPVVVGRGRRSCARTPVASAASRGCRSRRWPGRSRRRRAWPPAAGSPPGARPRRSPS